MSPLPILPNRNLFEADRNFLMDDFTRALWNWDPRVVGGPVSEEHKMEYPSDLLTYAVYAVDVGVFGEEDLGTRETKDDSSYDEETAVLDVVQQRFLEESVWTLRHVNAIVVTVSVAVATTGAARTNHIGIQNNGYYGKLSPGGGVRSRAPTQFGKYERSLKAHGFASAVVMWHFRHTSCAASESWVMYEQLVMKGMMLSMDNYAAYKAKDPSQIRSLESYGDRMEERTFSLAEKAIDWFFEYDKGVGEWIKENCPSC